MVSGTEIQAVISNTDASGSIRVNTMGGSATKSGLVYNAVPTLTSFSPTIGVSGKHISLTGTKLTGVTAVKFGNVTAQSFSIVNDNQIDAVVGGGANGSVSVVRNGETVSLAGFTFYGQPVIASISPEHGTSGTEVTISGENFYNISEVFLGTTKIFTYTALGTDEIHVTIPEGAATSKFKVIAESGTGTASADFTVDVVPVGVIESPSGQIEFYPNPVETVVHIAYRDRLHGPVDVRLLDSRGRVVSNVAIEYYRDGCDVDMSLVPGGLYVFKIRGREGVEVVKVMKK